MYADIEKHTISDKRILSRIEKEGSLLGKERIICDQLSSFSKKSSKNTRMQLILMLIRLYKTNTQIVESLEKELKNDKKLLKKRVSQKLKKVHAELHGNLLTVAGRHTKAARVHYGKYIPEKSSTHGHYHIASHHKKKAENLYKFLMSRGAREMLKKVATVKLEKVYKELISDSKKIAAAIEKDVSAIEKNRKVDLDYIRYLVNRQIIALSHFATNYSKSLIHTAQFVDNLSNKIILYHHKG